MHGEVASHTSGSRRYYACHAARRQRAATRLPLARCDARAIRSERIEEAIRQELGRCVPSGDVHAAYRAELERSITTPPHPRDVREARLHRLDDQLARARRLYEYGEYDWDTPQLRTPDGITLDGRAFGNGSIGVVLAHYDAPEIGQGMWFPFAQVLRTHGYRVLTFNFGGYCPGGTYGCSGGTFVKSETWRDITLAAGNLRTQGVQRVFVMGAGLGGHSSLWAASQPGIEFAGVISVSTPQAAIGGPSSYDLTPAILGMIAEPKLFVAGGLDDAEGKSDTQSMYAAAPNPKQLALLDSSSSGPELFSTGVGVDYAPKATQLILGFLGRYS
jgi:hypothetical protein